MRGSGCSMRRAIVLAGAAISLSGCATASSERRSIACMPVPEYRQEFLDRAADEVEQLQEGTAIVGILEDYAVMRAQGRVCRGQQRV